MSITVPDNLLHAVEAAAKRRRLTVSQFVEKTLLAHSSAVLSDPYLEVRASRATGTGWRLLDSAPDAAPHAGDELP